MPNLQEMIITYLESKDWYFDWDHVAQVYGGAIPTETLNGRKVPKEQLIRTESGWTVPQWGEYWSSDHLDPVGPKPKKRRYENLTTAITSQLLREEEPETYAGFFKDTSGGE